jgi:flagellar protein FliO/FliZ
MKWAIGMLLHGMFIGHLSFAEPSEVQQGTPPVATETGLIHKSEEEIPVNLTPATKLSAETPQKSRFVYGLLITILLLAGSAFLAKKHFSKAIDKNPNTQIKLLTQFHLGPKKKLAIVRVAGESILIGVTDHNVSLIKSLSLLDEDIPDVTTKDFGKELAKNESLPATDSNEEFSISGVRDFVSNRLRHMRSL